MQLLILAGGAGTRLRSVSGYLPKPLVPVNGVPLIGRQIEQAITSGVIDRILVMTGYGADQIESYIRDCDYRIPVSCVAETVPRGTAGAVLDQRELLAPEFYVMYADTVGDVDLTRFLAFHRQVGADASLLLHPNDHPWDSDLVEIGEQGLILGFHPCPHPVGAMLPNLVNAALYIIRREALENLDDLPEKPDFAKHVFPAMLRAGRRLVGYKSPEYLKDAGTPERIARVAEDLAAGLIEAKSLRRRSAAVFIDRDGVLNIKNGYINAPSKFEIYPGAAQAIARLNRSVLRTVVITNQPVIARGGATLDDLRRIHAKLDTQLAEAGAYLDALYFCPHHPDAGFPGEVPALKIDCDCRKPKTGLLEMAVKDLNIALEKSWMIGDTTSDMEFARRAGLRSILVRTGDAGKDGKYSAESNCTANDLAEAVNVILSA